MNEVPQSRHAAFDVHQLVDERRQDELHRELHLPSRDDDAVGPRHERVVDHGEQIGEVDAARVGEADHLPAGELDRAVLVGTIRVPLDLLLAIGLAIEGVDGVDGLRVGPLAALEPLQAVAHVGVVGLQVEMPMTAVVEQDDLLGPGLLGLERLVDRSPDTVRRLGRRQIDAGIHFLVPCGTTGENPTLSDAERIRIVEILVDEANGKVPVLAGAGGNHTAAKGAMNVAILIWNAAIEGDAKVADRGHAVAGRHYEKESAKRVAKADRAHAAKKVEHARVAEAPRVARVESRVVAPLSSPPQDYPASTRSRKAANAAARRATGSPSPSL